MKKVYRLSNLSKDIIIRLQRKEIERLRKENMEAKDALERAHRNVKGVANMLSHFAGAKE